MVDFPLPSSITRASGLSGSDGANDKLQGSDGALVLSAVSLNY